MINIFQSVPYVGAGPLRLGMNPQEVIALLGESQVVTRTWKQTLAHRYPGLKLGSTHPEFDKVEVVDGFEDRKLTYGSVGNYLRNAGAEGC